MKKTLFFSNILGDIMINNNDVEFNKYMNEYLKNNLDGSYSLVFIGAPGLGGEENYLQNIIKCFEKIDILFNEIIDVEETTTQEEIKTFFKDNNKYAFFLMGGNPITQRKIIDRLGLNEKIKNHDDLVIGFCAGAINLSKYSIITSDKDFDKPSNYVGLGREDICIEPHYNNENNKTRDKELYNFCKQLKTKIYAIPDESMIVIENFNILEFGKIYYFV